MDVMTVDHPREREQHDHILTVSGAENNIIAFHTDFYRRERHAWLF